MGRTNPTYRDALRAIRERWSDFRRALRRRDQPRFDRLFGYARDHADASGMLNHENPLFPALFSVDIEQEARLDTHEKRLDSQEKRLEDHEKRLDSQEKRLEDHEERLDSHEERVGAHQDRLGAHEERLNSQEERLDELEGAIETLRDRDAESRPEETER